MTDYYSILGLEKSAPLGDIKAAYRVLAKKYHPDVNKSAEAARQMQSINEAYETLGDPIKRAEYDQIREMGGSVHATAEQHTHVACTKCGKVDSTLRVSTFTTVWSFLVFSTYRGWAQILCARCRVIESLKFNLQVLVFGWWGVPWGIIWTVVFFIKNALGGHQPRENNAVLLATVGKNLIDAGDYIEAEKALIESLKLKDDPYVQSLLRTAKSQSGFKREKNHVQKVASLESHPLVYNGLLLVLIGSIGMISIQALTDNNISYSKQVGASKIVKEDPKSSPTPTELAVPDLEKDVRSIGYVSPEDKKKVYESNIRGLLHQSWMEKVLAKINLLRGERWNLPIHLGDSREHVYQVLGDPENSSDTYIAANEHLQQTLQTKGDTKFWMNKGIVIEFKDDLVKAITASGFECTTKNFSSQIIYGINSTDDAHQLISKLGLPYLPNMTNSNPDFSCSQAEFEWRLGNIRITRSILGKEEVDDYKKNCPVGYPWGGVTIEDLRPIIQEEKNRIEDEKIKNVKVSLTGKEISSKEIFEKYKERIYLIISYNSQDKPFCFGTGFLYRDAQIISNYHVVEDARRIKVKPLFGGGEEEDVAVEFVDKTADWVVMDKFHNPLKKDRELYPAVKSSENVETGDPVTIIGNPEGLTGSLSTGVVSSIRTLNGISWIQITAPISHGSSGSPVFDSKGRWIGLATLSVVEGQNLNLATPSKPIIEVMNSTNKINTINLPLKENYLHAFNRLELSRKMTSDDPKEREEAILGIKSLLEIYPDPYDQKCLLDRLAETYPITNVKEKLEIYTREIDLNLDWDYFSLMNKGDILWDLENQKQDADQKKQEKQLLDESETQSQQLRNEIYNIMRRFGAKEEIITSIEKSGGPDKIKMSWWGKIFNQLEGDYKSELLKSFNEYLKFRSNLKDKKDRIFVNPDHSESYKLFSIAIDKAKKEIQKDFDECRKVHESYNYPNRSKELIKSEDEIYQNQLIRLAQQHASDAYEIGYMYWMMEDNKNAVEWLEKSKKMNPDSTQQADKILSKIYSSTQK